MIRLWPGETECVAFSPLSGDVHLLSHPARRLLERLAEGPQTGAALIEYLAAAAEGPHGAEWVAAVEDALTTLDRAGLIEPRVP